MGEGWRAVAELYNLEICHWEHITWVGKGRKAGDWGFENWWKMRRWVVFGGMGTGLIKEFGEDGVDGGQEMPSCAPDLLDRERGGGGEGQYVCSLLASFYLFWITVNIWPFLFHLILTYFLPYNPRCVSSSFPLSPFFHILSPTLLHLSHFIVFSPPPFTFYIWWLTLYYTQGAYTQRADANSCIKTSKSYPSNTKVCCFL